ncbi:hypothetical protein [Tellurirhabdus rosea]|uniref:hypothetical protein n=1 Tax=Tellurirhabdus rosea TaxID=2674997 RepID=UPI002251AD82|nr:hypothetical protein [Tellurirhabdus rosea]
MMTSTNLSLPFAHDSVSFENVWTKAINGLHQRYYLLADSIMWFRREQETSSNPLAALRESKNIEELGMLQQEVMGVLCDLLADAPETDVTMALPIKLQLQQDAMILQQVNHRVDVVLSRLRMKNPAFESWMQQEH